MNVKFRIIFLFFAVFLNVVVIFGQEKPVTKENFAAVTTKAEENLRGKIYRSISTTENISGENSKPEIVSKSLYETIPPDRHHWLFESGDEKKEMIDVGARRYIRLNGGKWKRDDRGGIGAGMGCGDEIESVTYTANENVKLDAKVATLYEEIEKIKKSYCSDEKGPQVYTRRHWITNEGLLLKTETTVEVVGKNSVSRYTTSYEYNPKNLKITAPIK